MTKIDIIEIGGIRGIKNILPVDLTLLRSLLIFGENGSGKSSITDAIEWFYYDRIEHLSLEEIGRNGIEALRNAFLPYDKEGYIEIKFSDSKLNCKKEIFYKKPSDKLITNSSNLTQEHIEYINESQRERLILRYRDLSEFILKSKTEKLHAISDIIGFEEVTKYQTILRKAVGDLKTIIKIKDFNRQISLKQAQILEQLHQHVHNDEQYFKAIQDLISPLKLTIQIKSHEDINTLLGLIKQPEDKEKISQQISYDKLIGDLDSFSKLSDAILASYSDCIKEYKKISKDADKFKKINLERLLSEGRIILEKGYIEQDKCPLCLQSKNREELIKDLRKRIEELEAFKKEKENLVNKIKIADSHIMRQSSLLESGLNEKCLLLKKENKIKDEILAIKIIFDSASKTLKALSSFISSETGEGEDSIRIDKTNLQSLIGVLKKERDELLIGSKDNTKFSIYGKLELARERYKEICVLEKELGITNDQLETIEIVYNDFVKKQKEGLLSFLSGISKNINELYLYMNPSEKVDEIELIPLGEDDALTGITIQFKFHGKIERPPNRYLSESHLNCLGICLFLSSVELFNKKNGFFILDDVITSFDKSHRLRFARLLEERFSDYQILLFTHEKDWFEYVASSVRGKNWVIKEISWDYEKGVDLKIPLPELKERIDNKFKSSDSSELGNMLRKYLEHLLKEISFNLKVKLAFLYNDNNENRMCSELLSELKCKLKDVGSKLKDIVVIDRLIDSTFLGNRSSHDSTFKENISDSKVFYDDILELQKVFYCIKDTCGTCISTKYYDAVKKEIRCKCGDIHHAWKL